jgi:hypothetical protein
MVKEKIMNYPKKPNPMKKKKKKKGKTYHG